MCETNSVHHELSTLSPKSLENISAEVRSALQVARARDTVTPSHPDGLYLQLPGHVIGYTINDSDCGGYWTENRSYVMPDTPLRITKLVVGKHKVILDVSPWPQGDIGYSTTLTQEDLEYAQFFIEQPNPEDITLTADLRGLLRAQPTTWLSADDVRSYSQWDTLVGVRSAHPITSPVLMHSNNARDSGGLRSTAIKGVQGFYDVARQQTMVQILLYGSYRGADHIVSDWAPLEDIEFYHHRLPRKTAVLARLNKAAQALIEGTGDISVINTLLVEESRPAAYRLVHEQYAPQNTGAQFVLGRLAVDGHTISERFVPIVPHDSDAVHTIITANRILIDHDRPWVVSDTSRLATPLLFAENFRLFNDCRSMEWVERWMDTTAT